MSEENVQPADLKSVRQALYRERWKKYPKIPKSREETIDALTMLSPILTSKGEDFLLVNDRETGIVIFSRPKNLKCLCNDVTEMYADGTFKCCPKFYTQLYTIHGYKNGHYVPLVYDWTKNCKRHFDAF